MSSAREITLDISDPLQHAQACEALLHFAGDIRIFAFDAPMGAGKTTFIKSLCHSLGVDSAMSSPTYSIVNAYNSPQQGAVYHFDLYRLRDAEELFDLGFEDYTDGKHYCFIEWPELALTFLAPPYLTIVILVEGNNRYLRAQIFS